MITKITCRYSFEVLDFHCNDFGFTFNIGVSYLGIYKTSMDPTDPIFSKSGIIIIFSRISFSFDLSTFSEFTVVFVFMQPGWSPCQWF